MTEQRAMRCRKCGGLKTAADFYNHFTECKDCTKARVRAHRAANLERIREYDRQRGRTDEHREQVRRTRERFQYTTKARTEWRKRNPAKYAAYSKVQYAIKCGDLIPQPCHRCGTIERVEAHHDDYSKPLEVMWLCKKHHGERHQELNDARRATAA